MTDELLKLGAVPSVHTTLRRPGMSALHFVPSGHPSLQNATRYTRVDESNDRRKNDVSLHQAQSNTYTTGDFVFSDH